MAPRKKKQSHADTTYDEAVESLAEVVADELQGHPHTALDPFDTYTDAVKERVRGDMTKFRSRFAHGYHVLLDELNSQKEPKKKE